MKKTIICNIPMKENVDQCVYTSDDLSLPVAKMAVRYPIIAFLAKTLKKDDNLKIILLVKEDSYGHYRKNVDDFCSELNMMNSDIGAGITITTVNTEFKETKTVHEQLLGCIVDEIETGAHIQADVTYGPKDLVVVLFTALNFAEKFLECSVDNIVYGQASFVGGKPVDTKICDMIPLYCLGSVTNIIQCESPEKSRDMLKMLLSV